MLAALVLLLLVVVPQPAWGEVTLSDLHPEPPRSNYWSIDATSVTHIHAGSFSNFTNIVHLRLKKLNQLTWIDPVAFHELVKLQILAISDSPIHDLFPNFTTYCPNSLSSITIENGAYAQFNASTPVPFSACSSLAKLFLINDELVQVPDLSAHKSLLEDLSLDNNLISYIEEASLQGMDKLERLSLDGNPLVTLPLLTTLHALTHLSCWSCRDISYMQNETFPTDNNVAQLRLTNVQLSSLAKQLPAANNSKLLILAIYYMQQQKALNQECGLNKYLVLKHIYFARLSFHNMPEFTSSKSTVERLFLDYCQFATVPLTIKDLPVLTSLTIRYSNLTSMPAFYGTTQLVELQFTHTEISSIPDAFLTNFSTLRSLDVGYNLISHLGYLGEGPDLEVLTLIHNHVSTIEPGALDGCTALKELVLSSNALLTLYHLQGTESLHTLDLRFNSHIVCDARLAWVYNLKQAGTLTRLNWPCNESFYRLLAIESKQPTTTESNQPTTTESNHCTSNKPLTSTEQPISTQSPSSCRTDQPNSKCSTFIYVRDNMYVRDYLIDGASSMHPDKVHLVENPLTLSECARRCKSDPWCDYLYWSNGECGVGQLP